MGFAGGPGAGDLLGRDYSLGPSYREPEPYPLLQHVLSSVRLRGFAVEFGVGVGVSLGLIAARMPVVGFDSFQGLPEDWRPEYPVGALAFPQPKISNARIVSGWFADTLPGFDFGTVDPIALVHIDCDLYSSAATVLKYVGPHLKAGAVIVFDEFFGYPGAELHEERAWREYVEATGVDWMVLGHGEEQWAIQLK